MESNICLKCHKSKLISEFSIRDKESRRFHSLCKDCHSKYRREHYLRNREKYLVKAKRWNKKQTFSLRAFIFDYLSNHPCVDCGSKDVRVLDFDHERDKKMGIAQMIRNCHSLSSVEKEIKKCRVRCANCHRIKTFSRGNFWKNKMGP